MPFLIFGVVLRDMTSVVVTLILVISGLSLLVFAIVARSSPGCDRTARPHSQRLVTVGTVLQLPAILLVVLASQVECGRGLLVTAAAITALAGGVAYVWGDSATLTE